MENLRKPVDVSLITDKKKLIKIVSKPLLSVVKSLMKTLLLSIR